MATRKPKEAPPTLIKRIGNFIKDERWPKIFGLLSYLVAIFLILSFISYLFTWKVDQDKIMPFKWDHLFDKELTVENWFGKSGALISHAFFYWGFGISSFAVIFLFIRLGYRWINGPGSASIWVMLRNVLIVLILGSTFFELILPNASFAFSGNYGFQMVHWTSQIVGIIGTWLIFLFIVMILLVWFRSMNPEVLNIKKVFPELSGRFFSYLNLKNFFKIETEVENTPEESNYQPADITGDQILFNTENDSINPLGSTEVLKEQSSDGATFQDFQINPDLPIIKDQIHKDDDFELVIENEQDDLFGIPPNMIPQEAGINFTNPEVFAIDETEEDDDELKIRAELDNQEEPYNPILELSKFQLPPLDLLDDFDAQKIPIDKEELIRKKNEIVNTLLNYKIEITSIKATVGPTVTLYEIIPAAGVRISKIKNLEDDIALSLAALGIRIIAPIPGKGTIGIEVPNQKKQIVGQKELLNSERFKTAQMDIPIAFGKTISNEVFVADLAKMPHLLIAGATGQGKSVGINAILISILTHLHPAHIKLILIDPKKVELNIYNKLEHHYLAMMEDQDDPIITDTKKVIRTLNSVALEMDQRYDLLKKATVRNIREYNQKFTDRKLNPNKGHRFLPFIVLVIDEFADLIMTAGKEIETPIARIAQLARAVGIHLIIATQRPSVNIITGIIKANFPARIAFKVSAKVDSRTILDTGGADQLIGRGDMLLSSDGKLIRIQSGFVDTPEVDKVVNFIYEQQGYASPYLLPEVPDDSGEGGSNSGPLRASDLDELVEESAMLVVMNQHGSTSMIQRRLKLGYNRAGRIMDQLEALGVVGANEGSKPREVLMKSELEVRVLFDSIKEKMV